MADEDDLDEEFEDDPDGGDEEEGGKKGGKKKLLLLVVLPLLLIIGGVAGAYFAGLMDPVLAMITGEEAVEQTAEGGEGGEAAPEEAPLPAAGAIFYDLDQVTVDLNTSGSRRTYLQMRVSLQLADQLDIQQIETVMPQIMDSFITFLRELRLEDLQGTAGMYRIQEELLIRVNNAAAPTRVQDILFKEMLIQ
ncbi:MAG: flagellar basal body-associated FliL family protein [Rhodospirillaceae bacterium]